MSRLARFLALGTAAVAWRYFAHPAHGAVRRARWIARLQSFSPAAEEGRPSPGGDTVPLSSEAADDLVSTASLDSFPASDPPSYWAREVT
jgi:hypothetical protein